jgi:ligand-binding SRPBCC domain-containing protein
MGFYQFRQSQQLNASIDEVWDFISSPKNLKEITPDYMGFDITTPSLPEKMHAGMIISYQVKPLLGISTQWVTEITQVEDKKYFVDEQRVGPYAMWHHQHHIKERNGGVWMEDIISYRPPMGVLGSIANTLMIESKLQEIFAYRTQVLNKKYNGK